MTVFFQWYMFLWNCQTSIVKTNFPNLDVNWIDFPVDIGCERFVQILFEYVQNTHFSSYWTIFNPNLVRQLVILREEGMWNLRQREENKNARIISYFLITSVIKLNLLISIFFHWLFGYWYCFRLLYSRPITIGQ